MGDGAYVALLRGINVGGKNKLPMRSLADGRCGGAYSPFFWPDV